jgi:hypothetical protein
MNFRINKKNRFTCLCAVNFSLFSSLAILQLLLTVLYHPMVLLLCLVGGGINLLALLYSIIIKPKKVKEAEKAILEGEKNKIMEDLDQEVKRRRNQSHFQKN